LGPGAGEPVALVRRAQVEAPRPAQYLEIRSAEVRVAARLPEVRGGR
jgi:hypothetical protein